MKKMLYYFLFLTMFMCLLLSSQTFAAKKFAPTAVGIHDEVAPQKHICSFKIKSTIPATCKNTGKRVMICSCGKIQTITLAKTSTHKFNTTYSKKTSTQHLVRQTCSICRKIVTSTKNHNIVNNKCTLCGYTKPVCTTNAPISNHPFIFRKYSITGTSMHISEYYCKQCQVTFTRGEAHLFKPTNRTPATCIRKGTEIMKCNCGWKYEKELSYTDHSFNDKNVCKVCGYSRYVIFSNGNITEKHLYKNEDALVSKTGEKLDKNKLQSSFENNNEVTVGVFSSGSQNIQAIAEAYIATGGKTDLTLVLIEPAFAYVGNNKNSHEKMLSIINSMLEVNPDIKIIIGVGAEGNQNREAKSTYETTLNLYGALKDGNVENLELYAVTDKNGNVGSKIVKDGYANECNKISTDVKGVNEHAAAQIALVNHLDNL